jgi:hypothetical protein
MKQRVEMKQREAEGGGHGRANRDHSAGDLQQLEEQAVRDHLFFEG